MWTSVPLMEYQRNIAILHITVTVMLAVQTRKDLSIARVLNGYSGNGVNCVGEFVNRECLVVTLSESYWHSLHLHYF